MATKRELYEATEYIEKMDFMIAKLRTTKPGELTGKVGKNEILNMRRDELQQLVNDGYTVNQISEAMKNDVFGILPKTITEIIGNKNKKQRVDKKVIYAVKPQKPVATKSADFANEKATTDNSKITVKKDEAL
jgi:hypothetical protein